MKDLVKEYELDFLRIKESIEGEYLSKGQINKKISKQWNMPLDVIKNLEKKSIEKSNGEKKCPTCEFLGDIAPCDKCFNKIGL